MKSVYSKKGHDLKLIGAPSLQLETLPSPETVALCPEHIPFMKPRLKVGVGDRVALGAPLVEDKRSTDVCLLSPGGGRVEDIRFGPRRVIQSIVIALEENEPAVEYETLPADDIQRIPRQKLVQSIVSGGLWPLIRELPFRDYAPLNGAPPAIYVIVGNTEPFHPSADIYLQNNEELFDYGLKVLETLAGGRPEVCVPTTDAGNGSFLNRRATLGYAGPFPVHDPGVLVYRTKRSPEPNRSWFVAAQDVLLIAQLLRDGQYPTRRVVCVAGPGTDRPRHLLTRLGAPLNGFMPDIFDDEAYRIIVGGVFTGYIAQQGSYLGLLQTAVNLLPSGNQKGELLGLFRPGYRKPTYSRAFLSAARGDAELAIDCNFHGGERACIACGYCTRVCPVDILPQFTYKALLAGEVEEALAHGLLDCVECGLCSFVCPSKIELFETFKQAKADYHREQERE